jgi:hypothetical protein
MWHPRLQSWSWQGSESPPVRPAVRVRAKGTGNEGTWSEGCGELRPSAAAAARSRLPEVWCGRCVVLSVRRCTTQGRDGGGTGLPDSSRPVESTICSHGLVSSPPRRSARALAAIARTSIGVAQRRSGWRDRRELRIQAYAHREPPSRKLPAGRRPARSQPGTVASGRCSRRVIAHRLGRCRCHDATTASVGPRAQQPGGYRWPGVTTTVSR